MEVDHAHSGLAERVISASFLMGSTICSIDGDEYHKADGIICQKFTMLRLVPLKESMSASEINVRNADRGLAISAVLCFSIPYIAFIIFSANIIFYNTYQMEIAVGMLVGVSFVLAAIWLSMRSNGIYFPAILCALSSIVVLVSFGRDLGYATFYAGRSHALLDENLIFMDSVMGFDWVNMLHWFNEHPKISNILIYPYNTLEYQLIFIIAIFLISRDDVRLLIFLGSNAMSLGIVHVVGFFFPAIGAYGALKLSPADHPAIHLVAEDHTVLPSLALRAASELTIPMGRLYGLMTFPSYHAVGGVLVIWGLWQYKVLRIPGSIIGSSVILSALIHGSHHLTDVIAGCATGVFCIYATVHMRRKIEMAINSTRSPVMLRPPVIAAKV